MTPGEHLLVISHTFPPYKGIGGRRWAKFAKALAQRGFVVHVIHSRGSEGLKGSLWTDDVVHPNIIMHPLEQRYPTALFKRPLSSFGEKISYRFWCRAMPLLVRGNWFDKAVFWEAQLLRKSRELIGLHGIRNVVVTGAPFRLMAHVAKIRSTHPQINLVADFRDPWTWSHDYGQRILGPERLQYERDLEALVARTFDRLTSPAPDIVQHLRDTYGGDPVRYVHLPHAIDPDEMTTAPALKNVTTRGARPFRMIYAGSLYGAAEAEAYFDALLAAFQRMRAERPAAFARATLDLYITGHGTTAYEAKVRALSLADHIRFHAPLPPRKLFSKMASADLMLVFIPSMNRDLLGTKFNEIFYLRRPLLHIGVPGRVSRTIVENRLGASIEVAGLADTLPRIVDGEIPIEIDRGFDLSAHMLAAVTDKLERELLA